jgi:hypothetical protein
MDPNNRENTSPSLNNYIQIKMGNEEFDPHYNPKLKLFFFIYEMKSF